MWLKMYLFQIFVLSFIVTFLSAATIKTPEKSRSKRTIQYFFDGLLGVLLDNKNSFLPAASSFLPGAAKDRKSARLTNDRTSAISTLAKLSSVSTPQKTLNLDYDDTSDDYEKDLMAIVKKPPTLNQLPIPTSVSPTTMTSLKTQVKISAPTSTISPNIMSNDSNQVKISLPTITPNLTITNVTESIDSIELQESNESKESKESEESVESIESTTIEPEMKTDLLDISTTLETIIAETMNVSSSSSANTTSNKTMERKMDIPKTPVKASDRHTTQFYDGPLVVEPHRNDQHTPLYMDNCVDIHCNEPDSKEVLPYLQPGKQAIPIITMTIALPVSKVDQRTKRGQPKPHYDLFTLHSIPIFHLNPLNNLINDIQTKALN